MSYLTFRLVEPDLKRKTDIWNVVSASSAVLLGQIKWFPRWRQYCFFPQYETTFNTDCLREIADFAAARTQEHKTRS